MMDAQNVEDMNQDEHHSEEGTLSCSKLDSEQTLPAHTNNQTMLQATTEAAKTADSKQQETINGINDPRKVFKDIAQTGSISSYSWQDLKGALVSMLEAVTQQYIDKSAFQSDRNDMNRNTLIDQTRSELLGLIDIINELDDIPFTIQRISELLYEPFRYYDKADKFVRAMEKNFRVVSGYEEPKPAIQQDITHQKQQQQQQPQHDQQPEGNNIESRHEEMPDEKQPNNEIEASDKKQQSIDNSHDKNDASKKPEEQKYEEPKPEVSQETPQPEEAGTETSGES